MAFNPFLSMGEPVAPIAADAVNPFMMTTEVDDTAFTGDNPFATSNPFADFGQPEPAIADTVPMDIFGTAIHVESCDRPTELELTTDTGGVHNLPPETASLLQAVTGHMEQTSHHLLGRLPATRPPSPARDSPSPPPARPPPPRPAPPPRPDHKHILSLYSQTATPPAPAPVPEPEPEPEPLDLLSDDLPLPIQNEPPPVQSEPPPVQSEPPPVQSESPPVQSEPPPIQNEPPPVHSEPSPVRSEPPLVQTAQPSVPESPPVQRQSPPVQRESPPAMRQPPPVPPPPAVLRTVTSPPSMPVVTDPAPIMDSVAMSPPVIPKTSPPETVEAPMDCSEFQEEIVKSPEHIDGNDSVNPFADVGDQYNASPFTTSDTSTTNIFQSSTVQNNIFGIPSSDTFESTTVTSNNIFYETNTAAPPVSTDNMWATSQEPMIQGSGFTHTNIFQESQQQPIYSQNNTSDMFMDTTNDDAFSTNNAFADDIVAVDNNKDLFDAFSAKFDSAGVTHADDAWGSGAGGGVMESSGFEAEEFDPFLSMSAPPAPPGPPAPPTRHARAARDDQDENFSLYIRPAEPRGETVVPPALAPPPRPPAFTDVTPDSVDTTPRHHYSNEPDTHADGGETPPTPLFDEDVSVPLEDFPRVNYTGPGWEMQLRQPNKKKITGQRFWKKIFVRLAYQGDNPVVQLLNSATDKEPFQELPLQPCYSVSDISTQQYDQFGKIFTVKLQYVFYKERPGVRPGQVTKAERITNKLSQFAAYAIQGDYQGVKEFGSDLRKLGLPVEHAPQLSQLFKIGSLNYEDVKQFSTAIEEALFRLSAHRDRALIYKMEEVQLTAVDELYVEQEADGSVIKQIARVRIFFLGFLSGMPDVEVGVNDLRRQGREVVGRHDIIPDVTEEWIRVEDHEVHACVSLDDFNDTQIIRFKPPDACYIELMRFRVRPPKNRELPLQLKATWCVTGNKVELRADVLVPGFASRSLGQVPCEDVSIRFPIPECWIYLFRVEKHFRYGSVKSAHRRTGKVKGIERFLGAVDTLQESLIEVTSGQAKYEHQHRAIVWRMPRLPKEGQGAYTSHNLVSRMALTSFDQIPAELAPHAYVEFTMPATQVSHTTIRSVSLQNHDNDPPEKYVRYLARHEYLVGIERVSGESAPLYAVVTRRSPPPVAPPTQPLQTVAEPDSDSDSD